jgi:large subunit ribosomal protein L5
MQIPKLVKVVLNMGVGDVKDNPKAIETAANEMAIISDKKQLSQKPKNQLRHLSSVRV